MDMEPVLILSLILFGVLAGVLGTLFGLGGGIILVPVLTIIYGLTASEAAAISLVGIIATSTAGASFLVKERSANIRLGLLLEITTALGAMAGAVIAMYMDDLWLTVIFAAVMIYSGIRMALDRKGANGTDGTEFEYYDNKDCTVMKYDVKNIGTGATASGIAGAVASMTGVGGGAIKVPLMNLHMGVPMKAATATSSYMIGITAFSGALVYFMGGEILLGYAAAVAVGGFLGSVVGFKISSFFSGASLKRYFSILLFAIAVSVLLNAGGLL